MPSRTVVPNPAGAAAMQAPQPAETTPSPRRSADTAGGRMRISSIQDEINKQLASLNLTPSMEDESISWRERSIYSMEKWLAYSDASLYVLLLVVLLLLSVILGLIWHWEYNSGGGILPGHRRRLVAGGGGGGDEDTEEYDVVMSIFIAFQVILSAGFDDQIKDTLAMLTYTVMILAGLIVLGTLIGMITESFETLIGNINSGKLKAVEKDHTLVLGWNEGTVRLICQLCFVRRQFQQVNESWERRIFWWKRIEASTSVAKSTIVVMADNIDKEEMQLKIAQAFAERGISKRRTRLGCDVVCRVGDPSDVNGLQRIGAHRARAIVIQSTDDTKKSQGMTIRTLMSLRFVLYTCHTKPAWDDLRIVVEMPQPCEAINAAAFVGPGKEKLVHPQDLSIYLNSLLFSCLGQPGLAQVQMEMMDFESAAIKFRKASDLGIDGRPVADCALLWENAVFVGLQPAEGAGLDLGDEEESGLLPDPKHEIQADDTIIFFCQSSMPSPAQPQAEGADAAAATLARTPTQSKALANFHSEFSILICGWKTDWDKAESFLHVLDEITHDNRSDMFLHFVSDTENFAGLMKEVQKLAGERMKTITEKVSGAVSWTLSKNCKIEHTQWDEGQFSDLRPVVQKRLYNEAVIVPRIPTDEDDLSKQDEMMMMDNWIISVMLMLRHLQDEFDQQKPIHVIAENSLDATSKLAVAPEFKEGTGHVSPDFVNTLAIKARALCQVAAYPRMAAVIGDMCFRRSGCPNLMLVPASVFNLQKQTLTFRQVTQCMLAKQPQDGVASDVCLGVRTVDGILIMPPKQSDSRLYDGDDALIVLTRRGTSPHQYEDAMFSGVPPGAGVQAEPNGAESTNSGTARDLD